MAPMPGDRLVEIYIAQGLERSSNTGSSSIPRANSLINWPCTLRKQQKLFLKRKLKPSFDICKEEDPTGSSYLTSMAVWVRISPSQFQLL